MRVDHKQPKSYWDKTLKEFFARRGDARGFDASVYVDRAHFEKEVKELIKDFIRQYGSKYEIEYDGRTTTFTVDGYYYGVTRGSGKAYQPNFFHSVTPKRLK
jgi:hypothetical protein